MSKSFSTFLWIVALLFLANLFLLNGYVNIISPYESNALLTWLKFDRVADLPGTLAQYIFENYGLDTNYLRLGGLGFLLFCLFGFVSLARPLFGRDTLLAFFLVIASSPVFIFLMKISIPDTWLAGVQLLLIVFLLRMTKQGNFIWKIAYWIFMLLGSLINPLSALIWAVLFVGTLSVLHKDYKKFLHWEVGVGLLIPLVAFFLLPQSNAFLFSYGLTALPEYLLWMVLIIIGWFGFFLGGIRDLIWKLGKKEELSFIFLAWFISGIFSNGLILGLGFVLLVAKQLQLYFLTNYPRGNWVKTGSVLFLIASFFGALALIIYCNSNYGGAGFKSAIAVGGIFWMAGFWSILGIFSKDRSWVVGGLVFMGVVPMFIALMSLFPKFQIDQQWIKTVFVQEAKNWEDQTLYIPPTFQRDSVQYRPYAKLLNGKITEDRNSATLILQEVTDQTPNQLRAESFSLWIAESKEVKEFVFAQK